MTDSEIKVPWSGGVDVGVSTRYRKRGEYLIFFIHGLGCDKNSFRTVWDYDAFPDYSLLAIDLPGFGDSERPESFSYSLKDHAAICELVLRRFTPDRVHIVAHSMGGAVGLLLPEERLATAASFINIEGNLIREDCAYISRRASQMSFEEFNEKWYPDMRKMLADDPRVSFEKADPRAFYYSAISLVSWSDGGELLKRYEMLSGPKVYIYGEENRKMKILEDLKGMDALMINGCGHFPMYDNPSEFLEKVEGFLESEIGNRR